MLWDGDIKPRKPRLGTIAGPIIQKEGATIVEQIDNIMIIMSAWGRTRTGTALRPRDFQFFDRDILGYPWKPYDIVNTGGYLNGVIWGHKGKCRENVIVRLKGI